MLANQRMWCTKWHHPLAAKRQQPFKNRSSSSYSHHTPATQALATTCLVRPTHSSMAPVHGMWLQPFMQVPPLVQVPAREGMHTSSGCVKQSAGGPPLPAAACAPPGRAAGSPGTAAPPAQARAPAMRAPAPARTPRLAPAEARPPRLRTCGSAHKNTKIVAAHLDWTKIAAVHGAAPVFCRCRRADKCCISGMHWKAVVISLQLE